MIQYEYGVMLNDNSGKVLRRFDTYAQAEEFAERGRDLQTRGTTYYIEEFDGTVSKGIRWSWLRTDDTILARFDDHLEPSWRTE